MLLFPESVTTNAVVARARADTNSGLGTAAYVSQIAKLPTRRVIDAPAAAPLKSELRLGRNARATPPPAPRVANVLADRVTLGGQQAPPALSLS